MTGTATRAGGTRPGRRPGPTQTRAAVLTAARHLFSEKGYQGTTMRGVAAQAGVDASLVHHFFATKERLFVAALELPIQPAELVPQIILGGSRDQLGERIVRTFLAIWDDPTTRAPFLAVLRSALTHEEAARMLREFLTSAVLARIAETLGVPRLRIAAGATQLLGLVLVRYVLEIEPLASAPNEEIVRLLAPTIQSYLTG